jgi:hypothetical protein
MRETAHPDHTWFRIFNGIFSSWAVGAGLLDLAAQAAARYNGITECKELERVKCREKVDSCLIDDVPIIYKVARAMHPGIPRLTQHGW